MEIDSLHLADNDFIRRIHSTRPSGKLHRGHNITAATASIPSKYQTIVIDNGDKKGFMSKAKRFNHVSSVNTNPGPGSYVGPVSIETQSHSFSKKGTGGFVSKDKRVAKFQTTCSPGSGAYGLPAMLSTKNDYNRSGKTSVFQKPIAQAREKPGVPAPNSYQLAGKVKGKTNNVCADAAFKSTSKRDVMNLKDAKSKPAPWQYHVSDELLKDSVKVPFSSFKSKSIRQLAPAVTEVPGPGTYKPNEPAEPVQKTVFPRKHYLCISAPAMPLPATPPQPGPGEYEVSSPMGQAKHFMSGSAFVSTTSRWTGDVKQLDQPGPAHYRPVGQGKQSFIFNSSQKWI